MMAADAYIWSQIAIQFGFAAVLICAAAAIVMAIGWLLFRER